MKDAWLMRLLRGKSAVFMLLISGMIAIYFFHLVGKLFNNLELGLLFDFFGIVSMLLIWGLIGISFILQGKVPLGIFTVSGKLAKFLGLVWIIIYWGLTAIFIIISSSKFLI
jgi:hypothetical protein